MNDKELLELAAKAAGLKIDKSEFNGGGRGNTGFDLLGNAVLDWHNDKKWNPLTDDGDALRLAVKIGMVIDVRYGTRLFRQPSADVMYWTLPGTGQTGITLTEKNDCVFAATRRAIVRAAAEIGKSM